MKKPTLRQTLIIIAVSIAVFSLCWFIWGQIREKIPEGLLIASGRIEGREVTIAPKIQGRLKTLLVDESDIAKRGQLLAEIVSDQLEARYLNVLENASLVKTQVEQARVELTFTDKDTLALIDAAEAAANASRAQVEKPRAVLETAKRNYERISSSIKSNWSLTGTLTGQRWTMKRASQV